MYCPSLPDAPTMQTFIAPGDPCVRTSPSPGRRWSRSLRVFIVSPLVIVLLLFDDTEIGYIYRFQRVNGADDRITIGFAAPCLLNHLPHRVARGMVSRSNGG